MCKKIWFKWIGEEEGGKIGLECVCIHTGNLKLIPKKEIVVVQFEFTFMCVRDQLTNLEL